MALRKVRWPKPHPSQSMCGESKNKATQPFLMHTWYTVCLALSDIDTSEFTIIWKLNSGSLPFLVYAHDIPDISARRCPLNRTTCGQNLTQRVRIRPLHTSTRPLYAFILNGNGTKHNITRGILPATSLNGGKHSDSYRY